MPKSKNKEEIFLEIRETIKYLLRERERGRENFEISDFFKKELEDEVLNNFENAINRNEYEKTIFEIFGAKKKKNITRGLIRNEVGKLIRQYRMRSKKQILQKLLAQFQPLPSEIEQMRDFVVESYNSFMQEPLKRKISSYVKEGTTDIRRVMSILRRENYDVDQDQVKNILTKIIKDLEKTKSKYKRDRRKGKLGLVLSDDTISPVKQRLREQMQKSLVRKARYKKQRFVRNECPKFKFELIENKIDNDMRSLIYSGEKNAADISVKTLLTNNRITDIQISCLKKSGKRGAIINIPEFQKSIANNQGDAFIQRWLKRANKQLGFANVQELIWFLMSILNERFGLPAGVSNYLKNRFVRHLINLDKNLSKYVIEKALESL